MVPEEKVQRIPYTTCRMIQDQHCRMITCRRCTMVPEQKVMQVPYTTCKMVPEEHCETIKCRRCKMVSEEHCQQVPYTTCRLVREECVKQVSTTECTMEPYCVTTKVCRKVPVCVPVCEESASCTKWRFGDWLTRFLHRDECATPCY
jgi:hypothetical protein